MQEEKENNGGKKENNLNYNLEGGKLMARPLLGEEIIISGLSGVFPESMNVDELKENLFNKVNMVTRKARWDFEHPEIPIRSGTILNVDKYDSGFFGLHERQSHSLDASYRLLQERVVEAIFDAGMHPSDLEGTKTGVFVGMSSSESDKVWHYDILETQTYVMTGTERSMAAHRLSYFLKLKGPSFTADTACSSSIYALDLAYRSIRSGEIEAAIVAGTNLCLHPYVTMQFARFGVLSHDGLCKSFDERGNGYVRSEAIACIILQKYKSAKRVYAQLVHVKTNSDGYKEQGLMFPSAPVQTDLLAEFYDECNVDKFSLSYLEAHGTGTLAGDPQECLAIDTILTKDRKRPLLMGSIKSNIGHSEPTSAICSIAKSIIVMETGIIPSNLHFTTPRKEIEGIIEGRMKVVADNTPLEDDNGLIGVSSFGFGGSNGHALLKWNMKEKVNKGLPKDDLPRLVCVSGRTPEAVNSLLDAVSSNELDAEFVGLLHEVFRENIDNHLYRGYAVVNKTGEASRSLKYSTGTGKYLILALEELSNWYKIVSHMILLPTFSGFIQRLQKNLQSKGVSMFDMLLSKKASERRNIRLLGSTLVHAGILEILNTLSIKPKVSLVSYGKLLMPYLNGLLTLEETVYWAFILNEAINNKNEKSNTLQVNGDVNCHVDSDNLGSALDNLKICLNSTALKDDLIKNLSNILGVSKSIEDDFGGIHGWATHYINSLSQNQFQDIESDDLDSIVFQVGNVPLRTSEDLCLVSLFDNEKENSLAQFLESLGRLYEFGYNPQISKLYPLIQFPVSRGTRMVSPYIKWLHKREKFVPTFNSELMQQTKYMGKYWSINSSENDWTYVTGHVIDGRNLFPAAGYLFLVWSTFALIKGMHFTDLQILFENCKFMRITNIPKKRYLLLEVAIQPGTGNFEIVESNSVVAKGKICLLGSKGECNIVQGSDEFESHDLLLQTKDIYKELRLRGYNYEGAFKAIEKSNVDASKALIRWDDNWVTFIDNMFQLMILQLDSRLLYVPIYISKLIISARDHISVVNHASTINGESFVLPAFSDKATGTIRSGGITITGLLAKTIPRKKDLRVPVLEKYEFVPNDTELDIFRSIRVNMQIILENTLTHQIKGVEVIDEFSLKDAPYLTPIAKSVLEDLPLVQPLVKIFSKTSLDVPVEVEDKKLNSENNCLFVIASSVSQRPSILGEALLALKDNGFIISREGLDYDDSLLKTSEIETLTVHRTLKEILLLLQKKGNVKETSYVKIASSDCFSWIPKLQNTIKKKDVVLYAENEPTSGILGLVNCLRCEADSRHVRCVFLMDKGVEFQPTEPFIVGQLRKNMAVNIFKNNQWGTYRHLSLGELDFTESEHCFINQAIPGDLSSLQWNESPLYQQLSLPPEHKLVHVYYSSLNFRDIMTATRKLDADLTHNRLEQEYFLGMEYSGRDSRGRRVMGTVSQRGLSTSLVVDSNYCVEIPDSWSLEDAATVPIVYQTLVYGLIMGAQLKRGETILIHSGTGGIGQAAICLCLYYSCKVFTTVGSQEKRTFLKKYFPILEDRHIGDSHDTSFEQMIHRETNGKGVDIVLNSLAEEKLIASIRCLARGGRLVEIGKYDMANHNDVNLLLFQKEASFYGVMFDQVNGDTSQKKLQVKKIFKELLRSGAIKPLTRTVFNFDEVEEAFRFMATGKHIGKVVIKIRESEQKLLALAPEQKWPCLPRFFCNSEKVYVIVGGLGGFGLELADWLILRGARKLVLTSRQGISNGYQEMRIRLWKSYGTIVKISTASITTKDGCRQLIQESSELGPIDAIFNLAVVLEDAIFENQSPESFMTSFAPKATATVYLDELTREMCPDLSYFVVFSSVSCGRGNAGQTNYGMANSVMERVCEERKRSGYPALAIEWGAVGQVGLVAELLEGKEIEIGGTLQQKISSCLQVLDTLLKQQDATVVSSIVVAEKRGNVADNIIDAVLNILGVTDVKSISLHSTLAELGMDSISSAEVKQTLERDFEVFLTAKDVRTITLARLKEIEQEKHGIDEAGEATDKNVVSELLFRLLGNESESIAPYIELNSKITKDVVAPSVLLFPGIEGFAKIFDSLAADVNARTIGLQFIYDNKELSIVELSESLLPTVEVHLSRSKPFNIIAYSYGSVVALEVVNILESKGYRGTVICLDGSPQMIKEIFLRFDVMSQQHFETNILTRILSMYVTSTDLLKHKEALLRCNSWDEKVNLVMELIKGKLSYGESYLKRICNGLYWRVKALKNYKVSYGGLGSVIKLYKPKQSITQHFEEDYGLSKISTKPVEIQLFDGNHVTFLNDAALAESLNRDINK